MENPRIALAFSSLLIRLRYASLPRGSRLVSRIQAWGGSVSFGLLNTARFAGGPLPFPPGTIVYAGPEYGKIGCMETARKITVEVPQELLEKAQRASGTGITQTVRTGLQLVAASRTYARLRKLRGKVHFSRTWAELKADR